MTPGHPLHSFLQLCSCSWTGWMMVISFIEVLQHLYRLLAGKLSVQSSTMFICKSSPAKHERPGL